MNIYMFRSVVLDWRLNKTYGCLVIHVKFSLITDCLNDPLIPAFLNYSIVPNQIFGGLSHCDKLRFHHCQANALLLESSQSTGELSSMAIWTPIGSLVVTISCKVCIGTSDQIV